MARNRAPGRGEDDGRGRLRGRHCLWWCIATVLSYLILSRWENAELLSRTAAVFRPKTANSQKLGAAPSSTTDNNIKLLKHVSASTVFLYLSVCLSQVAPCIIYTHSCPTYNIHTAAPHIIHTAAPRPAAKKALGAGAAYYSHHCTWRNPSWTACCSCRDNGRDSSRLMLLLFGGIRCASILHYQLSAKRISCQQPWLSW